MDKTDPAKHAAAFEIGDVVYEAREVTAEQERRLGPLLAPHLSAMDELIGSVEDLGKLSDVVLVAPDLMVQLCAYSFGQTKEWVEALSKEDWRVAVMLAFSVNIGVFSHGLLFRRQVKRELTVQD